MGPFGLALKDYWEGNKHAKVIFHRDDGLIDEFFVSHCFRSPEDFLELEKEALQLCFGKVLDLGAGVGPISLELQKIGFEVYSIDISKEACEIMEKRGLKHVYCSDVYDFQESNFDTILLMGRTIGFVGDLVGMEKFLRYCKKILSPKGIVLLDSLDVRVTSEPDHIAYHKRNRKLGRYIGVVGLQMEYNTQYGEPFNLLHIDPETLNKIAKKLDWKFKILRKEESGNYLAKICR